MRSADAKRNPYENRMVVDIDRFELSTTRLSDEHSNQLNYISMYLEENVNF